MEQVMTVYVVLGRYQRYVGVFMTYQAASNWVTAATEGFLYEEDTTYHIVVETVQD
jgi:hypothetical protein